jgi:hypothetical protein
LQELYALQWNRRIALAESRIGEKN